MKKAIIIGVLIIATLIFIASDLFVNPSQSWIQKNQKSSAAPRLQYTLAGYLYMVAQRQSKAIELYQTAFKLFPGHPDEAEAHYRIGLYYEGNHDYPKATEEYHIIMEKWPDLAQRLSLANRIEKFRAYRGDL